MEKETNKEVLKRLDLMITLIMELLSTFKKEDKEPMMKKVMRLRSLNFTNEEIGIYLNKDKKQVAKLLYENKRKS